MVFEENSVGVGDQKEIIHSKRWYVYLNKKKYLISGGYSMEVSGSDGKTVLWGVVYDHVIEE